MLTDEPSRHPHVLLARQVDVELELVAQEHAGELLLRLHPRDRDRDVAADARALEVLGPECRGAHGHDADAPAAREHLVDERDEEQARGEHRHRHRGGQLPLELDEEPAVGRDGADALPLELARPVDEGGEQSLGAPADHEVGVGALYPVVAHREREGCGVAHVARDPRKARVEHEDADGEAVLVEAAAHAPRGHRLLL